MLLVIDNIELVHVHCYFLKNSYCRPLWCIASWQHTHKFLAASLQPCMYFTGQKTWDYFLTLLQELGNCCTIIHEATNHSHALFMVE